jgi:cytochrome c oxidase subunit 1
VLRRIFSTDHKVIGLQYGFTSLFFLLVGFVLVLLIRWQHAYSGQPLPLSEHFSARPMRPAA